MDLLGYLKPSSLGIPVASLVLTHLVGWIINRIIYKFFFSQAYGGATQLDWLCHQCLQIICLISTYTSNRSFQSVSGVRYMSSASIWIENDMLTNHHTACTVCIGGQWGWNVPRLHTRPSRGRRLQINKKSQVRQAAMIVSGWVIYECYRNMRSSV